MTSPDIKRCPENLCLLNSTDKSTPRIFLKCGDALHQVCLEVHFINQQRLQQNLHCPMCMLPASFPLSEIQPLPVLKTNSLRVKFGIDMLHDLAAYNLALGKTNLIRQRS